MWRAYGDRDLPLTEAFYCNNCNTLFLDAAPSAAIVACDCSQVVEKCPPITYTLEFW